MGLGDLFKKNKKNEENETEEMIPEEASLEEDKAKAETDETTDDFMKEVQKIINPLNKKDITPDSQIMGIVENNLLPVKLNDDPVYVITSLIAEKGRYLNNYFKGLYAQQNTDSPYSDNDFSVSMPFDIGGVKCICCDMPEKHLTDGLSRRIYIAYNERFVKYLYVTVEKYPDKDRLASWIDGEHEDHGEIYNNEREKLEELILDEEIAGEKYSLVLDKLYEQAKGYPAELLSDPEQIKAHANAFINALMQAQKLKQQNNREDALKLVREVIKSESVKYTDDDKKEFKSFHNTFEVLLYANLYHPCDPKTGDRKQIVGMQVDLSSAYLLFGAMMLEKQQYDRAIEIIWKAVELNPVNVQILFALADAYKGKRYLKSFLNIIKRAHTVAVRKADIARIYRNYAFYYSEMKDHETAAALLEASRAFDPGAPSISSYKKSLEKEAGYEFGEMTQDEIKRILFRNGIAWGQKELVKSVERLLEQQFSSAGNEAGLKMCNEIKNEFEGV